MADARDGFLEVGGVIAVILAGGSARRLGGGDKGLLRVGHVSILDRVVAALEAQGTEIVLSANDDPARFAAFGVPVLADDVPGRVGPLAGVLAGMDHAAAARPEADTVLTVPGDVPFLPLDLVVRLDARRRATGAAIVRAWSGDRVHNVVALWSVALRADLRRALVDEGVRKVGAFASRYPTATERWAHEPLDPFLNVNTPEDLLAARASITGRSVS